ncbi:MAG: hypothetical protein IIB54_09495 [Planctomycetes bacterium]|nr:hypothetical protein [Planctomycetota bacterium]
MKRVMLNTTILLVLGLAINILIAWSCALFATMEVSGNPQALTTQVRNKWIDRSPWPHKLRPGRTLRSASFGLEYDLLQSGYDNPNFWHTALAMRAGLPLLSLYGERWSNFASEDAGKDHEDQFAFVYSIKSPLAEDEGDGGQMNPAQDPLPHPAPPEHAPHNDHRESRHHECGVEEMGHQHDFREQRVGHGMILVS